MLEQLNNAAQMGSRPGLSTEGLWSDFAGGLHADIQSLATAYFSSHFERFMQMDFAQRVGDISTFLVNHLNIEERLKGKRRGAISASSSQAPTTSESSEQKRKRDENQDRTATVSATQAAADHL